MSNTDPSEVFRVESQELLEQVEQGLLDLENNPADNELVARVFRALHTLKGSGAMFGYEALAAFTHHCETAFDRVRKGQAAATPKLIGAVLAALDHMRTLAASPDAEAGDGEALLTGLRQAMETESALSPPTLPASKTWRIRFSLPADCLVNGTRPLSLLDELRGLGEAEVVAVTDRIPALPVLVPTECHLAWQVTLKTEHPRSVIEDVFIFVIDDMTLEIEEVEPAAAPKAAPPAVTAPEARNVTVLAERLKERDERAAPEKSKEYLFPVASGIIAGDSLMAVAVNCAKVPLGLV